MCVWVCVRARAVGFFKTYMQRFPRLFSLEFFLLEYSKEILLCGPHFGRHS